jgi:hypothetical protein
MKSAINPKLRNDPIFQRVLADAMSIQDRFEAQPVYAKSGKGCLKSAGVEELKRIKSTNPAPIPQSLAPAAPIGRRG